MRKFYFAGLIMLVSGFSFAQQRSFPDQSVQDIVKHRNHQNELNATDPFGESSGEWIAPSGSPSPAVNLYGNAEGYSEYQIGATDYDLQSNKSLSNRIWFYNDGTIGAVWMMGFQPVTFPDRGTGYNYYDGTTWGPQPTARIESEKTGWPSYAAWGANGEINVAHTGLSQGLLISRRSAKGTGTWAISYLAGPDVNNDLVWPRIMTSGVNHEILHVIVPSGNATSYNGQTPALLYNRSNDGGQTWNILHQILPGTGSSYYTGINADEYSWAESRGNTIAFVVSEIWKDMFVMKSTDNGDTWQKLMVWEHPYPFFDFNTTLTTDTLWAPDNSADIAIDPSGKVHVVCGLTRVAHFEYGTTYSYFPFSDGIAYWNETIPPFTAPNQHDALDPIDVLIEDYNLIGWTQDVNNSGTIDFLSEIQTYRELGISTMPSISIDENNNVFLVYSSTTETYDNGTNNYKHIWARGSGDGGATWGNFRHLTDDLIHIFDECIYPVMSGNSNDKIHLIYNTDYEPGLALDDDHGYVENRMIYQQLDKSDLITFTPGISVFPYSESFESGFGAWQQSPDDDFDWTRKTGPTPTSGTGPQGAYEGAYYLFTESSTPNYPNKSAGLFANFDFSQLNQPVLTFWYHMYGSTMGSLKLQASTNGGNTWNDLWSLTGNQGDIWLQANVSLAAYGMQSNVKIRFLGTTGAGYWSDMAIDFVEVVGLLPPPVCTTPLNPPDGAQNVSVFTSLTWNPASNASGYLIYFGTDNPPTNIENGTDLGNSLFYEPPAMLGYAAQYYWKIVPYNGNGQATGCPVWVFTTEQDPNVPPLCTLPDYPPDGATDVSVGAELSWFAAQNTTGYLLYFGTDNPPTNIENGTDLGNALTYELTAMLQYNTQYFWKLVPYNTFGQATGCPVWEFSTMNNPNLPPSNLQAQVQNQNDVFLTWDEPYQPEWITWCDLNTVGAMQIGLTGGGTFQCASKWEPVDLTAYTGKYVTAVRLFWDISAPEAIFNIRVWSGADGNTLLLTQLLSGGIAGDWNEVTLANPVEITPGMTLWFGYEVTHSPGSFPAGTDAGPAVPGKGDMVRLSGGVWESLSGTYALDYNWGISAMISNGSDGKEPAYPLTMVEKVGPADGSLSAHHHEGFTAKPFSQPKALTGYNVYRNGVKINTSPVLDTQYLDQGLSAGNYDYWVTAVYTGGESGPGNTVSVSISGQFSLDVTAILEGPFNGTLMNQYLNSYGYIPLTQPYNQAPWYYNGSEQVTSIPNNQVVDWVLVELREAPGGPETATSATVIDRRACFILSDGAITGPDGSNAPLFTGLIITQNLYVTVWHRNHLGILSNYPLILNAGVYAYDFTDSQDKAYGGGLAQKQVNGHWVMASGDGNSDGSVNNADKLEVWVPQAGFSGYLGGDFTMNGYVDNADKIDSWTQNAGRTSQVPVAIVWSCGDPLPVTHTAGDVAPVNKTVNYGTVMTNLTGSDKCWITQNLGSDQQAISVTDNTEASAGWYWQFNRKQGYKHDGTTRTPNSPWITFINENADWQAANDPCSVLLGAGWRLPTYTEWYNADFNGSWGNQFDAYASVLKLHAAGNLYYGNGSLNYRGIYGYYWSSTQISSTVGWYLLFGSTYCDMTNDNKTLGFTGRCLRD
ncbi:MAG: hypothetical protein JXA03_08380 [Bacteroidales bacterium]|nr:hypothetical protein [Bacteroidales bacterium]